MSCYYPESFAKDGFIAGLLSALLLLVGVVLPLGELIGVGYSLVPGAAK